MSKFRDAVVQALAEAGVTAEVVMTTNRTTLVSIVPRAPYMRGDRLVDREVRIAARFADLGPDAVQAVVGFATGKRGGKARVQALIRDIPRVEVAPRKSRVLLDPRGLVHDLTSIAESERETHFPDTRAIPIGWSKSRRGKPLRAIRFGLYEPTAQVIRIHPRLDDTRVPDWFVGFIVYHEYLHHVLGVGPKVPGGLRRMHTPEFKQREEAHPRYREALAFEAAQLHSILSARW